MLDLIRDLSPSPQQCWHYTVLPAVSCGQTDTAPGPAPSSPHTAQENNGSNLFFSFPFDNLCHRKYGGVFFSKLILTHSYQLQCWQRGRGTCSVGLKGWWLPSYFCQRKARADYSSVANSSSVQTKIGLPMSKASSGSMVLQDGLLQTFSSVTSNSILFHRAHGSSALRYCIYRHLQFPEHSHYRSIFPSCWVTSDAFNDSARDRDAQTLLRHNLSNSIMTYFTKTIRALHKI